VLPPRHRPVVAQLYPNLGGIESHGAIEHIAPGEVEQSIGVFQSWVVLDIDSVVGWTLKGADAHVGHAGLSAGGGREYQVVSEKALPLEFQH